VSLIQIHHECKLLIRQTKLHVEISKLTRILSILKILCHKLLKEQPLQQY